VVAERRGPKAGTGAVPAVTTSETTTFVPLSHCHGSLATVHRLSGSILQSRTINEENRYRKGPRKLRSQKLFHSLYYFYQAQYCVAARVVYSGQCTVFNQKEEVDGIIRLQACMIFLLNVCALHEVF
jgi:hypothetical protein